MSGERAYDASGAFEATEVVVSSEATGRLIEFNVEEGDLTEAGYYAGYIDTTQLYLRKRQLMAGAKAVDMRRPDIQKQIAVLEAQIAVGGAERKRMENLVGAGAGNRKQLDDIISSVLVLQRQLDAQRSALNSTSGSVEAEAEGMAFQVMQLDDLILKSRIINPIHGIVLTKYAQAGEMTASGRPLYKIADMGLLHLRAYITASQLSLLKLGDKVEVYADFGDKGYRQYEGLLTWVSDKAEFTPKGIHTKDERSNLVYAVKIAVRNDGYLKIGQYGEVRFPSPRP
ncbi:MAG: HlyD family efflux transporter periplasmic adaptor subunit [Tannerellaceae bacterium]|nr:HlyD family efflux transporter periplasmic adaptor subunit [Tannerellaceae bacterium]